MNDEKIKCSKCNKKKDWWLIGSSGICNSCNHKSQLKKLKGVKDEKEMLFETM